MPGFKIEDPEQRFSTFLMLGPLTISSSCDGGPAIELLSLLFVTVNLLLLWIIM